MEVALDPDRLVLFKAELTAIELWDSQYDQTIHDKIAHDSFRARQVRRQEILDEIVRRKWHRFLGLSAFAFDEYQTREWISLDER